VICTRDRPAQLARCLDSLAPNMHAIGEVILVDNGTRPEETRAITAGRPSLRVVAESRPGLSIARNTGLRHATHAIVAFTDDDVVLHPDWAARLLAAFACPRTACVTGLVLPLTLETEAQVVFERGLGGFGRGFQRIAYDAAFFHSMLRYGVPVWRIGAGANLAVRRDVLVGVGGFDERLGAGAAGCSEDSEVWYRMLAAGWTCRYEPAAVAFHEHRRDWSALETQMRDYMRGHVAALLVQFGRHGHAGNLRRLALTIPASYARALIDRGLGRDRYGRARLVAAELRGVVAGLGAARWALRPWRAWKRSQETGSSPRELRRTSGGHKAALPAFLARNPFPDPRTLGFFYREKMRALHRLAPDVHVGRLLDIGGGRSGLAALLYPAARVTTLDMEAAHATAAPNRWPDVDFVCGDATRLPFPDAAFDAVTMFDLLEHVPAHELAAAEALRVLRPGGFLLVSTPRSDWRYPRHSFMASICDGESELLAEWGHVRRGYDPDELAALLGGPPEATGGFGTAVTSIGHDISFARLGRRTKKALWLVTSPVTLAGYLVARNARSGGEIVGRWTRR
jgi:SAM-dependent methyltransferase/GT2 family glycosyltransferase